MDSKNVDMDKINGALRLLNEAARDEKSLFQDLLSSKYDYLKGVLTETDRQVERSLDDATRRAREIARETKDYAVNKAKHIDEHVHHSPWQYIAGAGFLGLLIGFLFGRTR